jgi:DinB superfamily/Pentapeptide repeats (8 copies)
VPEEFDGDLSGAVFWGADLRGARFRDVNLTDVKVSHAWLVDVDIDAFIERVVVNGVDVTAFVNEHDRWYPLRAVLGAADPDSMRAGWTALGAAWAAVMERARRLPDADLHESVNGEWSFVQTLRHLVFAMDKWFSAPVLGRQFDPIGLPNSGSINFPWPDLDPEAAPSLAEVLAARAEQATRLDDHLAAMTADDLTRTVEVLENGPHLVRDCVSTVLEEEFWHHRYAARDLAELEGRDDAPVEVRQ